MRVTLTLTLAPGHCLGATSEMNIGEISRPAPTPKPWMYRLYTSMSWLVATAIRIEPSANVHEDMKSAGLRPNLSAM